MSEKLLDRALRRVQESNDKALARAADAEARLAQAGDLLTALGIPLTTDPSDNVTARGVLSSMYPNTPRTLTLAERIIVACRRASSGADAANVPAKQQAGEAPRGGLYRTHVDETPSQPGAGTTFDVCLKRGGDR